MSPTRKVLLSSNKLIADQALGIGYGYWLREDIALNRITA